MDVYSIAEADQALWPGFTVPPDAVHRPAGSLADYGEDELMSVGLATERPGLNSRLSG